MALLVRDERPLVNLKHRQCFLDLVLDAVLCMCGEYQIHIARGVYSSRVIQYNKGHDIKLSASAESTLYRARQARRRLKL